MMEGEEHPRGASSKTDVMKRTEAPEVLGGLVRTWEEPGEGPEKRSPSAKT